jgi:ribose 5-phosphate isomerase B
MTDSEAVSNPTKILVFGADHGGYELKQSLISYFREWDNLHIDDCGAFAYDAQDDYPAFAFAVATRVAELDREAVPVLGVVVCRSSAGVIIAANKVVGVRAVACDSPASAVHARAHNAMNCVGLAGDHLDQSESIAIITSALETEVDPDPRHTRRRAAITDFEHASKHEQAP